MNDIMSKHLFEKRPLAMILRHAERHPFVLESKEEPLLTQKGHEDAFQLGQVMRTLSPLKMYYSPITRCRQTASELCRGISQENGSCKIMGNIDELGPALFVVDWDGIISSIQEHNSAFLRLWFDGKIAKDLIVPLERAAKSAFNILINQLSREEITTVNISHDWNIMVLLEYYFHLRHEDIGYPEYLSGIVAYRESQTISLHYGKYRCILKSPTGKR